MTKLKICGLKDLPHAISAAEAGADFLGFVFVPGVRRQLQEDQARNIIQEFRQLTSIQKPRLVGLFANQPLEEVKRILDYCDLDMAQLCGDELPDYWQQVNRPVIKQVKVKDTAPREGTIAIVTQQAYEIVSRGHICLLDNYEDGTLGGSGQRFDWDIAADVAKRFPIVLAGGLTPANVQQAISTIHPWGVDVSSGVETNGVKDVSKIEAFAEAVLQADKA
ncbi:MAG: phosphoribosylanthranilate isomerase [Chloroflexi bacterium]|nr:phosphoribosylanthranilate isomerase [Chloroflexota bacterium]